MPSYMCVCICAYTRVCERASPYLGDRLSFFRMLRWKSEGAKQTAMFIGVIWFSSTEEVTSLRKQSSVCSTSRFSSDISMMAACTACKRWSFGTSTEREGEREREREREEEEEERENKFK